MSRGFGTILTAGVAGTVLWAYGKSRQQQAAQEAQVLVIPASTGDSKTDNTRDLIFGLAALLGAGSGTTQGKAPVAVQQPLTQTIANAVGFDWPSWAGGGSTSAGTGNGNAQPLLDMIAKYEGGVNGYDVVYGGSKIRPPKPITRMTVGEVRNWQEESVRAGSASSAVGKYQIIRKTMDKIISSGTIKRSDLFDRSTQEKAGLYLLEGRGYSAYRRGSKSLQSFAKGLAQEWASLPVLVDMQGASRRVSAGQSYYAGDGLNKAHYSVSALTRAIQEAK